MNGRPDSMNSTVRTSPFFVLGLSAADRSTFVIQLSGKSEV